MKYIIKRRSKTVAAETESVFDACILGFCFAADYPELTRAGWVIYCQGHRADGRDGEETLGTTYTSGYYRAQDIAQHINNPPPPPPPVHDCPKCDCKSGCCR